MLDCLCRAGCKADHFHFGVVAIQDANLDSGVLLLNLFKNKTARASDAVTVIKPPKQVVGSNGAPDAGPPEPKAATEAPKQDDKSQTTKDEKERDRSPRKKQNDHKELLAATGPWEEVDTGGLRLHLPCGRAGHGGGPDLCKGKKRPASKPKTVRHDLFKHMIKHAAEYKQWFEA